jgi:N-methylhydantoinase B
LVKGDLLAEVACCQAGAAEILALIDRFGWPVIKDCIERMYDHGETIVRDFIRQIPDGSYTAHGHLDDDGLSDDPILFKVTVIVEGEEICFDLSDVPEARKGPLNTPLPSTVSACRIVLAMLAGNESPNEGHFRPLRTVTRPGSMFHPVAPQPTFLYGWPLMQLTEALFEAFAKAMPGKVPSGSAGDICGAGFSAYDKIRGETIVAGNPFPVGLGAFPDGDGSTMMHLSIGQSSLPSAELLEAKFDFLQLENWEITEDSAGIGKYRGGSGWRVDLRVLRDVSFMTPIERTKVPSWAQAGGAGGATNKIKLHYPDGRSVETSKVTGVHLPKGTLVEVFCGGGGGFGDPRERDPEAVKRDVRLGFCSEDAARQNYPHAFA